MIEELPPDVSLSALARDGLVRYWAEHRECEHREVRHTCRACGQEVASQETPGGADVPT